MGTKVLQACEACHRQYNVSDLSIGQRFHCLCGEALSVKPVKAHEAVVVRCSSCGGARSGAELNCEYCHSGFTLHERDLHTICPECMARISDISKHCHHCGVSIQPQEVKGELAGFSCPVCGDDHALSHRAMGEGEPEEQPLLECNRCAGVWLSNEAFELLERNAIREAAGGTGSQVELARRLNQELRKNQAKLAEGQSYYRPCPVCAKLMHRINYGKRSSVLVDTCHQHGLWFDLAELEGILRWIRSGGLRHKGPAVAAVKTQRQWDAKPSNKPSDGFRRDVELRHSDDSLFDFDLMDLLRALFRFVMR